MLKLKNGGPTTGRLRIYQQMPYGMDIEHLYDAISYLLIPLTGRKPPHRDSRMDIPIERGASVIEVFHGHARHMRLKPRANHQLIAGDIAWVNTSVYQVNTSVRSAMYSTLWDEYGYGMIDINWAGSKVVGYITRVDANESCTRMECQQQLLNCATSMINLVMAAHSAHSI